MECPTCRVAPSARAAPPGCGTPPAGLWTGTGSPAGRLRLLAAKPAACRRQPPWQRRAAAGCSAARHGLHPGAAPVLPAPSAGTNDHLQISAHGAMGVYRHSLMFSCSMSASRWTAQCRGCAQHQVVDPRTLTICPTSCASCVMHIASATSANMGHWPTCRLRRAGGACWCSTARRRIAAAEALWEPNQARGRSAGDRCSPDSTTSAPALGRKSSASHDRAEL